MSDLFRYVDAVVEYEAAMDAGRSSFVTPRWLKDLADGMDPVHKAIINSCSAAAVRSARKGNQQKAADELMARFAATLSTKDMEVVPAVWDYAKRRAAFVAAREGEAVEDSGVAARYLGVWRSGTLYRRGAVTTHKGVLWHCEAEETKGRPGDAGSGWRMMHKQMAR